MAYRLLNSNTDPYRIIRSLRLPRDLQQGVQTSLERIWAAENIIDLSHAHGRALGMATAFGLMEAITRTQFTVLAEAFTRMFEHRLAVLTEHKSCVASSHD
jgi:hypothetical protein